MLKNTRKTNLFLSICLFFVLFQSCQDDARKANNIIIKIDVEKLMGKWQSIDNPKSMVEFSKNRMFSYYEGLKLSNEALTIYNNCVTHCLPDGVKEMPCFITDGKKAENCFKVLELTDKKLTFALVGKEHKSMRFQKM